MRSQGNFYDNAALIWLPARRRKRIRAESERSRKSAKRPVPPPKNDFKLKALAIKKNQIHVIGAPSLKLEGIPTFLDVEGMPDRDFYYLIGLKLDPTECPRTLVLGRSIGRRARDMGELSGYAQVNRECADRKLWRVQGTIPQTDERALRS